MLLIDAALRYGRNGYRILPLHTPDPTAPSGHNAAGERVSGCSCRKADCGAPGKHPRTLHGLKDATTEEAVIRRWWMRWPDANIGLLTGSGLLVLDVDPRNDGDNSLDALETQHGGLETLTCKTGGNGWHFYFATHTSIGNAAGIMPGLDIRGEAGYVVAPPSLHASGARWSWRRDVLQIAPAPAWLLSLIQDSRRRQGPAAVGIEGERIPQGCRDISLYSLACALRRRGLDDVEIFAALELVNRRRCEPPVSEDDVLRITRSAMRFAPGSLRRHTLAAGEAHA